jgi:hypothetical protein
VQVCAELVDPTLGDRSGQLPRVEPHPPRYQLERSFWCHEVSGTSRG